MSEDMKQPAEEIVDEITDGTAEETVEDQNAAPAEAQPDSGEPAIAEQLEKLLDKFTRLAAEYDNYRKRTARERDSIYQNAKADTIQPFLAVYDNLERAVTAEGGEDSPHKKGLELIFKQYKEILQKLGVTLMEALGQPFDPSFHNAVGQVEDESLEENVVADVLQNGFMMDGKVLRVAMVRVAK